MLRIKLTSKEFHEINKIRQAKKIKISHMLKELNIKLHSWERWRVGDSSMPFETFQKIEQFLGITFDHLGDRFNSNYIGNKKLNIKPNTE